MAKKQQRKNTRFTSGKLAKFVDLGFDSKAKREVYSLEFNDQIVQIKKRYIGVDGFSIKERFADQEMWNALNEAMPEMKKEISDQLMFISGDDVALTVHEAKQKKTVTFKQVCDLFDAHQNLIQEPIGTGEIGRLNWLRNKSTLRKKPIYEIGVDDILKVRQRLLDHGAASGEFLKHATVNTYINNMLGRVYTYARKHLHMVTLVHLPQTIEKLDEIEPQDMRRASVETPSYPDHMIDWLALAGDEHDKAVLTQSNLANRKNTFSQLGTLIRLFAETGIRNKFLARLRWDEIGHWDDKEKTFTQFDFGKNENVIPMDLVVRKVMKGRKVKRNKKNIPLTDHATKLLMAHSWDNESQWVFPSPKTYLGDKPTANWEKRLTVAINWWNEKHPTKEIMHSPMPCHSFRAYCATSLAGAGAPINIIALVLGVTIETATRYVKESGNERDIARDFMNLRRKKTKHA